MTLTNAELLTLPGTTEAPADGPEQHSSFNRFESGRLSLLVEKVCQGDAAGMEELYGILAGSIRYLIVRQLGIQVADDKLHDTFLIIVDAIQRGVVREPERLLGFVRTVVHRQVAGHIREQSLARREQQDVDTVRTLATRERSPEAATILRERVAIMQTVMAALSTKERDVLMRFYTQEQTQEQICREMKLTETQFRLLKSRAKAKFAERCRARVFRNSGVLFKLETAIAR